MKVEKRKNLVQLTQFSHLKKIPTKQLLTKIGTPEPLPEEFPRSNSLIEPTGAVPLGMITRRRA